jgi:hypothetical protein
VRWDPNAPLGLMLSQAKSLHDAPPAVRLVQRRFQTCLTRTITLLKIKWFTGQSTTAGDSRQSKTMENIQAH